LIGFGNVGQKLASLLTIEKDNFSQLNHTGLHSRIRVIGITTLTKGSLYNKNGIDLVQALKEIKTEGQFLKGNTSYSNINSIQALTEWSYDAAIELSPLNIAKKGEPVITHLAIALSKGKHVISANKGPLAFQYQHLKHLAKEKNALLLYESTVMDGCPIFNLVRHTLQGCKITKISGILNSTTNFVLSQMAKGEKLADAVKKAQELGFAETDPSHDLEGWDAACKLAVLANTFMDGNITPSQVEITGKGITEISYQHILEAKKENKQLKLIAWAAQGEEKINSIKAGVSVQLISDDHPFATVKGSGSSLRIETDLMTPLYITQEAPGLRDTAYGVINNLLTVMKFMDCHVEF